MKNILVTGGAGFIGGNFIHYLLGNRPDCHITCLDALTYAGNLETLKSVLEDSRLRFVHGDITDREAVYHLFGEENFDAVVNFAAESHVDRSIKNPDVFVKTNVLGTLVMLNAAKAAWELPDGTFKEGKKFLHVSTDEVYGALELTHPNGVESPFTTKASSGQRHKAYGNTFFEETTKYNPHSPYSASKASSDHFVRAYHDTYGMPTIITNCSNNYGPYQFPEKLIPLFINNILAIVNLYRFMEKEKMFVIGCM